METNMNFVAVKTPIEGIKTVNIRTEDGNLKYNMLIKMLESGAVVPTEQTNEILLELLKLHRKDSAFLKHLIGYAAEASMVIEESEAIVGALKDVIEELAGFLGDNADVVDEVLEEYDLKLDDGDLVWIDEDGSENEIIQVDADELLEGHNLHFEEEGDKIALVLG